MYVCVCNAVTESDVHEAVEAGVRSMRELVRETGCSSNCAKCVELAVDVLDEALREKRSHLQVVGGSNAT